MAEDIVFDDSAANDLKVAAKDLADTLQSQSFELQFAVDAAYTEFRGVYAQQFLDRCNIQAEDRGKLVGKLRELQDDIEAACIAAEAERERLASVQQWEEAGGPSFLYQHGHDMNMNGMKPFSTPISVPSHPGDTSYPGSHPVRNISVSFLEQSRISASGAGGLMQVTSAVPDHLFGYVDQVTGMDNLVDDDISAFESNMAQFASLCTWVRIDEAAISAGARAFLDSNRDDRQWLFAIAQAFVDAGSGTLLNAVILKAVSQDNELSRQLTQELFYSNPSPDEVASIWATFTKAVSEEDVAAFLEKFSFELASMDGLPPSAQSQAALAVLDFALGTTHDVPIPLGDRTQRLQAAMRRMGFDSTDMTLEEFDGYLYDTRQAYDVALKKVPAGVPVQILSLGKHGTQVTAAISMGDLESASTVETMTYGMYSSTASLTAPMEIYEKALRRDPDMALVSWVGYDSPGVGTVLGGSKAEAGAQPLARFWENIDRHNDSIDRFLVTSHSFGTNVVTRALQMVSDTVDIETATYIGSAGVPHSVTPDSLGVDNIYVADASKDWLNEVGSLGGISRTDPQSWYYDRPDVGEYGPLLPELSPEGLSGLSTVEFIEIDVNNSDQHQPVTLHALRSDENNPDQIGYLDEESVFAYEWLNILLDREVQNVERSTTMQYQ